MMKHPEFFRTAILIAAAWAGWACIAPRAEAADLFPTPGSAGADAPIEIVADRLETNNTEKYAEFSGSVKATQGKFSITSETLRIYYEGDFVNPSKEKSAPDAKQKSDQDRVKKIVATGRVHIVTDQYIADSERAEYETEKDVLTLSGSNSRVVSGKNTLSGTKIVLDRKQGQANVEGGASERVKAVIYQEGKKPGGPEPAK